MYGRRPLPGAGFAKPGAALAARGGPFDYAQGDTQLACAAASAPVPASSEPGKGPEPSEVPAPDPGEGRLPALFEVVFGEQTADAFAASGFKPELGEGQQMRGWPFD